MIKASVFNWLTRRLFFAEGVEESMRFVEEKVVFLKNECISETINSAYNCCLVLNRQNLTLINKIEGIYSDDLQLSIPK